MYYIIKKNEMCHPGILSSICLLISDRSRIMGSSQAHTGELLSSGAVLEPAAQTQRPNLQVSAAA